MLRALLLLALLLAPGLGHAAESTPVVSERARVLLVSELAAVAPGTPFRIALAQSLAPGWHTYWRNAGDAGAPSEITLGLPDGGSAGPIAWPAPARIPYGPLVNFGFTGSVALPITVTPPGDLAPGGRFRIEAEATWLVCEKICIPEEGRFALDLPVAAAPVAAPAQAALFAAAEARLPRENPFVAQAGFSGPAGALRVEGAALSPATVREAFFFPHAPGLLDNAAPQPARIEDGVIVLRLARGPVPLPERLDGVLALTDPQGRTAAFLLDVGLGAVPAGAPGAIAPAAGAPLRFGFWQALLLAFAGGLLLNLMPCVFPILAMKAFALARMGGAARAEVRGEALAYTAGVLACFAAIGGLLVGVRAAGGSAGWGVQFTQPAFVAAMAWLMLLVGLNLSGVFAMGRAVGAGQALAGRGGRWGAFFTGLLAVLVATPCTAPFMAAALGTALALPAAPAMAVFLALGLGLAAPYALLALFPGLARLLPRPGPWMERLRQFLAFPMYAAAAWLVWVLAQQAGPDAVLLALAGGLFLALAAWLAGVAQQGAGRRAWLAAALPVLAALALLPRLATAPPPTALAAAPSADAWSEARVAALRAEGRGVFVNVTAAWCISCKVNEQVALNREAVRAAFARSDIAYLKADWTRGDAAVGALLRAHGREGVPLYLLYPAGGAAPRVLPEILTEGIVLDALAATRLAARN